MTDLTSLKLIARGGQADIYEFEDNKIIRVPRRPQDYERISYEHAVYSALAGSGIAAPKVYPLVYIDQVPCIIMDRINGTSMMAEIAHRPFSLSGIARELARLHQRILNVTASGPVVNEKEKARFCIGESHSFAENEKSLLLGLLDALPEGEALCHGDFHPGNLLRSGDRYYTIDWSAASCGDFVSDIAHTYILLKVVPRIPGISPAIHFLQTMIGSKIARVYLRTIRELKPFDLSSFSRWIVIKAAERTYYGLPSEQNRLTGFVRKALFLIGTTQSNKCFHHLL
jgi:tRNA A-37 threonylcarbamoyl transferase component Bud32